MAKEKKLIVHNPNNLPTISYKRLQDLQGDLKTISEENLEKLKASLKENGFFVPAFVWFQKRKPYMLDAHQRKKALASLEEDGYKIPEVPYIKIDAKNRKDAKIKLLMVNSRFGHVTQQGFTDFVSDIDFEDISCKIDFPDIDIDIINFSPDGFGTDFSLPEGDKEPFQQMTFILSDNQAEDVKGALDIAKKDNKVKTFGNENINGNALYRIVKEWVGQKK